MKAAFLASVAWLILWVTILVGWVMNIVQIVHLAQADSPVNAMFILKVVGVVVAPLGGVLGLFG
jgi:hypothetical protein